MSYSEVITYDSSTSLTFDSSKVQVTGGALTLKGTPYTTTNPIVTTQHQNTISALTSFAESSTLPTGTAIGYQLVLNGISYWYNATNAAWAVADNTYATSNTASAINANASTLFTSLGLITNQYLSLNVFLHTSNTSNAPTLTSNTLGYTWTNSSQSAINQCVIAAYLADLAGNLPTYDSTKPVSLNVSCDRAFFHGSNFIEPFTKSFTFNSQGILSASVIETATPGVPLSFSLTYYDGLSLKTTYLFRAIVPNQPSINLSNLSTAIPYDFG